MLELLCSSLAIQTSACLYSFFMTCHFAGKHWHRHADSARLGILEVFECSEYDTSGVTVFLRKHGKGAEGLLFVILSVYKETF